LQQENEMKNLMKQAMGAVALSAMSLSMIGTDGAVAKPKSDKIKVNPPTAAEVETGQLLIKDRPVAKSSTGGLPPEPTPAAWEDPNGGQHFDKGKGRPVAKSSTGGQPPEPTAAEVETGQLLIRDRPVSAAATENDLCGLPYTPPCDKVAPAVDVETGQLLIRDRPVSAAATENDLCGLPYTPPCDKVAPAVDVETGQLLIKDRPVRPSAARKNKTGWIIPTIAVAAALGAVLASGNNDDNPTSP
jgi:hypothetical protein